MNKEQAAALLDTVPESQVKIWHGNNNDYHIVMFTRDTATDVVPHKGKWALVVDKMHGVLDHETAEFVRQNRQGFRGNFTFRDISAPDKL